MQISFLNYDTVQSVWQDVQRYSIDTDYDSQTVCQDVQRYSIDTDYFPNNWNEAQPFLA